jgi:hypothetical protein
MLGAVATVAWNSNMYQFRLQTLLLFIALAAILSMIGSHGLGPLFAVVCLASPLLLTLVVIWICTIGDGEESQ